MLPGETRRRKAVNDLIKISVCIVVIILVENVLCTVSVIVIFLEKAAPVVMLIIGRMSIGDGDGQRTEPSVIMIDVEEGIGE